MVIFLFDFASYVVGTVSGLLYDWSRFMCAIRKESAHSIAGRYVVIFHMAMSVTHLRPGVVRPGFGSWSKSFSCPFCFFAHYLLGLFDDLRLELHKGRGKEKRGAPAYVCELLHGCLLTLLCLVLRKEKGETEVTLHGREHEWRAIIDKLAERREEGGGIFFAVWTLLKPTHRKIETRQKKTLDRGIT